MIKLDKSIRYNVYVGRSDRPMTFTKTLEEAIDISRAKPELELWIDEVNQYGDYMSTRCYKAGEMLWDDMAALVLVTPDCDIEIE